MESTARTPSIEPKHWQLRTLATTPLRSFWGGACVPFHFFTFYYYCHLSLTTRSHRGFSVDGGSGALHVHALWCMESKPQRADWSRVLWKEPQADRQLLAVCSDEAGPFW